MQHENVRGSVWQSTYPNSYNSGSYYGTIAYGSSAQYSSSNVKTYVEQYASTLASTYGISSLSGSAITKAEIDNLCMPYRSLEEGNYCSTNYPWVYQTTYWSGSACHTNNYGNTVWRVHSDGAVWLGGYVYYSDSTLGVRAVVQIPASSI